MIRILQVVNNMHRAGLETVLMNYYRQLDKTKFQFDFLTHREGRSAYDEEIEQLGGKIYRMPRLYPQNYAKYMKEMARFFSEHPEYKIVHSHIDSMSYLPLLAAKRANVPVRISHSHNTGLDLDAKLPLKLLFKKGIPNVATHFFSCGEQAGKFLFGNRPFFLMKNAIDVNKFSYSSEDRKRIQLELGFNEADTVVGCIGRLSYQKNHKLLIDVFSKAAKARDDLRLVIVGEGENRQNLEQQISKLHLEKKVKLLGSRDDVNQIYHAFDLFVLPSRFEGIPVVGVEAQAAGLPCLFADTISDEVIYSSKSKKIGLKEEEWVSALINFAKSENHSIVDYGGYDIKQAMPLLEQEYRHLNELTGNN